MVVEVEEDAALDPDLAIAEEDLDQGAGRVPGPNDQTRETNEDRVPVRILKQNRVEGRKTASANVIANHETSLQIAKIESLGISPEKDLREEMSIRKINATGIEMTMIAIRKDHDRHHAADIALGTDQGISLHVQKTRKGIDLVRAIERNALRQKINDVAVARRVEIRNARRIEKSARSVLDHGRKFLEITTRRKKVLTRRRSAARVAMDRKLSIRNRPRNLTTWIFLIHLSLRQRRK